ncbi:MAG: septum formation initiator family protein [Mycoplasmatota bacterium]
MKKKRVKRTFRRLAITGPICLVLIMYSVINIFSYGYSIYDLNMEKKELEDNLVTLNKEKDYLSSEILKLEDDEYLASYARENYLYSKEDEYIIKIEETTETIEELNNKTSFMKTSLLVLTVSFVIILVILFSNNKKKV